MSESIQDFNDIDKHADLTFSELPSKAQKIAINIYQSSKNKNVRTRELDRSIEFRGVFEDRLKYKGIDVFNFEFYMQAVDTFNRYFNYLDGVKL